ncbi:MAG TPA: type IV secretory system conjugative DNA transfer family protein [Acidocella sp.]|nr:type IV secretory system conjugative DNA transfer family protein [Acidocella sp.]
MRSSPEAEGRVSAGLTTRRGPTFLRNAPKSTRASNRLSASIPAAKYVLGTLLADDFVPFGLVLATNGITGKLGFKAGSPVHIALTLVAVAVAALFVLRRAAAPMIRHYGDPGGDTHGTARFATPTEIKPLLQYRNGLLLGRDIKTGKLLRYDGPSHLLTMAPTRTGKSVGTVIPNLLTVNRSVICIDPKGENTLVYDALGDTDEIHCDQSGLISCWMWKATTRWDHLFCFAALAFKAAASCCA